MESPIVTAHRVRRLLGNLHQAVADAAQRSKRAPLAIAREAIGLHTGRTKLSVAEYLEYELDDTARTRAEREAFIGNECAKDILSAIAREAGALAMNDRVAITAHLKAARVAVTPIGAVIDCAATRVWPTARVAHDNAEIATAIAESIAEHDAPVAISPVQKGAPGIRTVINRASAGGLSIAGADTVSVAQLRRAGLDAGAHMVRTVRSAHEALRCWSEACAHAHLAVRSGTGPPDITHAVFCIAAEGQALSGFDHPGAVACAIDIATGTVTRAYVRERGATTRRVDKHPATGAALEGTRLPDWGHAKALALRSVRALSPMAFASVDLALTAKGPEALDAGPGADFALIQCTHREGVLNTIISAHLERAGVLTPSKHAPK